MIVLIRTLTSRTFQLFNNLNTKLNYPVMFLKNFSYSLGVLKTIKIPSEVWFVLDPIQFARTCRHRWAHVPCPAGVQPGPLVGTITFSPSHIPRGGLLLQEGRWQGEGGEDCFLMQRKTFGQITITMVESWRKTCHVRRKRSSFWVGEVGSLYQGLGIPALPPSSYLPLHFFLPGFPALLLFPKVSLSLSLPSHLSNLLSLSPLFLCLLSPQPS